MCLAEKGFGLCCMTNEFLQSTVEGNTPFFRETEHFAFLAETLVSDLIAGASIGRRREVRVWSAACSTGEEAYAIAIALSEGFKSRLTDDAQSSGEWRIEVIATDTDTLMLDEAKEAIYNESSLSDFPQDAKKLYFQRGRGNMAGKVRVKQNITSTVHFAQIDLRSESWPVEGTFDAIFFRDMLSSYPFHEQERLLRGMLRYLHPHSYLILSPMESVPWLKDAVTPVGRGIYQLRPRRNMRFKGKERRTRSRPGLTADSC